MTKERKNYPIIAFERAKANLSNERVRELYDYYRARVGCGNYPMGDRQRQAFDKIIINMCGRGELAVPGWLLSHPKVNYYSGFWMERDNDVIAGDDECEYIYRQLREELQLLNRLLDAARQGQTYELTEEETEIADDILKLSHCPAVRSVLPVMS